MPISPLKQFYHPWGDHDALILKFTNTDFGDGRRRKKNISEEARYFRTLAEIFFLAYMIVQRVDRRYSQEACHK